MWKYLFMLISIFILAAACTSQTIGAPTSTSTTPPLLDPHFPQMEILTGGVDFIVTGELALENGCLRVNKANLATGDSFLLIWDENFATRREQGVVQVIDAHSGEVLASVGDDVEIGGGEAPADIERYLKQPIPIECPGPNWIVHEALRKIERP